MNKDMGRGNVLRRPTVLVEWDLEEAILKTVYTCLQHKHGGISGCLKLNVGFEAKKRISDNRNRVLVSGEGLYSINIRTREVANITSKECKRSCCRSRQPTHVSDGMTRGIKEVE